MIKLMINEVEGTAVFDRSNARLYLLCHLQSGVKTLATIPIRPKGTSEPQSAWEFEIKGEQIHVTPSLKLSSSHMNAGKCEMFEIFHNGGAWSVPFKDFLPGGQHDAAYDLFRSLNPEYDPSKV